MNHNSVVKWVGGKQKVIKDLLPICEQVTRNSSELTYIEPFIGGGAIALYFARHFEFKNYIISDINPDLYILYRVVKETPEELIKKLQPLQQAYDKATTKEEKSPIYYSKRKSFNSVKKDINFEVFSEDWIERVADFIFLNKTCFNGLYRVNSKGEFNTPIGSYKKPSLFNSQHILDCSRLLSKFTILLGDYKAIADLADENSFVYLDPPYRPLSSSANFTSYDKSGFNDTHQLELADFFREMDSRGAKLMLSNSGSSDSFFAEAYAGFNLHQLMVKRSVNSDKNKRGAIPELVITNF